MGLNSKDISLHWIVDSIMELCLSWGIVKLGFGLTLFQEANIGLRGYKHPTEGVTSVILVNMSTEVELSACLTITLQTNKFFLSCLYITVCGVDDSVRCKPAILVSACSIEHNVGFLHTVFVDRHLNLINTVISPVIRIVWFVVTINFRGQVVG
jgi:hypothetical protein